MEKLFFFIVPLFLITACNIDAESSNSDNLVPLKSSKESALQDTPVEHYWFLELEYMNSVYRGALEGCIKSDYQSNLELPEIVISEYCSALARDIINSTGGRRVEDGIFVAGTDSKWKGFTDSMDYPGALINFIETNEYISSNRKVEYVRIVEGRFSKAVKEEYNLYVFIIDLKIMESYFLAEGIKSL